jgi:hypothetical protein
MVRWKRVLRSASSERFLALRDGRDAAAVDLHYLADGTVAGTVVLLEGGGLTKADVPDLLRALDNDFLPGVDLGSGSVMFTVVAGKLVGNYEGAEEKA